MGFGPKQYVLFAKQENCRGIGVVTGKNHMVFKLEIENHNDNNLEKKEKGGFQFCSECCKLEYLPHHGPFFQGDLIESTLYLKHFKGEDKCMKSCIILNEE